jgi:DNA-damage-inducible protein J
MFLRHSIRYGIPFDLRLDIPNEETFAAIDDVNNNRNMSKTFKQKPPKKVAFL